jgi:hypothetical protein
MRNMIIGLGVAAVALMAGAPAADAQTNFPFGKRPYCWSGDRSSGGMPECSFYTWEQCQANRAGGGDHCYANPSYAWGASQQDPRKRQPSKRTAY